MQSKSQKKYYKPHFRPRMLLTEPEEPYNNSEPSLTLNETTSNKSNFLLK